METAVLAAEGYGRRNAVRQTGVFDATQIVARCP